MTLDSESSTQATHTDSYLLTYHSSQTVGLLSIVYDITTFKNSKQQKGLDDEIQEQNSVTCYEGTELKNNMY